MTRWGADDLVERLLNPVPPHPARYSQSILPILRAWTEGCERVLDPLAGIGTGGIATHYSELEPEWAAQCEGMVTVGDAAKLPYASNSFDGIVTSPVYGNRMCLAPYHRVLTQDLRWVPVGDLQVGDTLIAFDEQTAGQTANGKNYRRKWRLATVLESKLVQKPCVRVLLENGDRIVCTYDHPWLIHRARTTAKWIEARDLCRYTDRPSYALRQLEPWQANTSYEAGWLAGMFDGEGSLAFGVHGSPKLSLCQVVGPTNTLIGKRLTQLGYRWSALNRRNTPGQPMQNFYINGGFPGILRAMGELRPERLISKLANLDVASRTIKPWKVRVVAVEPVGMQEVQHLSTSTKTYFGEGYMMHNSDHHNAQDSSTRVTYRHKLGRPLHPANAGQLQWGSRYRNLHIDIWHEVWRVLRPGGRFILNIADHIRAGERAYVSTWHLYICQQIGFRYVKGRTVDTPGMRYGENGKKRVGYEYVYYFEKGV